MENKTLLWQKVEKSDIEFLSDIDGDDKLKAIDAHSQILVATKLWGPFGMHWGIVSESFTHIKMDENSGYSVLYQAILYYPVDGEEDPGNIPISSDIRTNVKNGDGWKVNRDYAKKVATDALTKGLSKIGFNADVFMGSFDGNKYLGIDAYELPEEATEDQITALNGYLEDVKDISAAKEIWLSDKIAGGLTEEKAAELIETVEDLLLGRKDA